MPLVDLFMIHFLGKFAANKGTVPSLTMKLCNSAIDISGGAVFFLLKTEQILILYGFPEVAFECLG